MKLTLPEKLKPYSGVINFMIILLVSHFFWKYTVLGEDDDEIVRFFGLNISQPFIFMASHTAQVSYSLLKWLGFNVTLNDLNVIRHLGSGNGVHIVWSCTGIKQAYILFCILAFSRGPWKHKLWYIPLGLLCVYLFNILRITFIAGVIDSHPQQFEFWHEHVTKYAFYAMIFGLWVIWEEKIRIAPQPPKGGL